MLWQLFYSKISFIVLVPGPGCSGFATQSERAFNWSVTCTECAGALKLLPSSSPVNRNFFTIDFGQWLIQNIWRWISEWPDVGIKLCQLFPKSCPKSNHNIFTCKWCLWNRPKSHRIFGPFCTKFCRTNRPIWSHCGTDTILIVIDPSLSLAQIVFRPSGFEFWLQCVSLPHNRECFH